MKLIIALATVSLAGTANPQHWRDEVHDLSLDAICALGDEISRGCASIRDRRVVDATRAPWRAIGRVNFTSVQIRHHCTGSLVSERLVLTAAHCLYNFRRKAWIPSSSLRFVAGYQRGQAVSSTAVVRYVFNSNWNPDAPETYAATARDWALLELKEPIGRETGYLDLSEPVISGIASPEIELAGYSALRPHALSLARDCGHWADHAASGPVILTCSAMRGDSGAPVLFRLDGEIRIAGILSAVATRRDEGAYSLIVPASAILPDLRRARAE